MTAFLLIHGAFRGGWSLEPVAEALRRRGCAVAVPTLRGMDGGARPSGVITLADWVHDAIAALDSLEALGEEPLSGGLVAVGHSQGGIVLSALAAQQPGRLAERVYLDAPVALPGQRGVDLVGSAAPDPLPPADTWIAPSPLGDESELDPSVRAWVNERLVATPIGPSLDRVIERPPTVRACYAFCEQTPAGFPSTVTRARFERLGVPFVRLDAPHDVALVAPELVVELLLSR